jgi:protocatechuate 3,4-dioxygenase beta subunit
MTNPGTRLATLALGLALLAAACGSAPTDTAGPPASPSAEAPSAAVSPVASPAASPAASSGSSAAKGCTAPAAPTLAQTEGPYYLAGAPELADLVAEGMAGTRLTYTGIVVDTSCAPIAGARVETWQADGAGVYDNAGYTLRGWVLTDAEGRFTIRTIVPGEYPGRTEHIHIKVTPPGGATLTTQMYFPGSTVNDEDGIYDPSLELAITQDGDALVGEFTFVLGG